MSTRTYFLAQIHIEKDKNYQCIIRDEQCRRNVSKEDILRILESKSPEKINPHKVKHEAELITSEQADGYAFDVVTIGTAAPSQPKKKEASQLQPIAA